MKLIMFLICNFIIAVISTGRIDHQYGEINTPMKQPEMVESAKTDYAAVHQESTFVMDEINSNNLEYTDFMEGTQTTDVIFICTSVNDNPSYKLVCWHVDV